MALGLFPAPVSSQLPASLLDEETELRSIRFRFLDTETFSKSNLTSQIGLTEQGKKHRVKSALAFLPLFSEPPAHPFDPLSLQRDVVRLREFYRAAGFPNAYIRYEVELDQDRNVVDVEFLITEGLPRTLLSVAFTDTTGSALEEVLAPEIVLEWQDFVAQETALVGERFGNLERARMEGNPLRWLMDRGYPFPTSVSVQRMDSAGLEMQLTVRVEPGSRSRIGSLGVEGITSVDDGVALREVPIREGDWFSASRVNEGRRRISGLDLFRMAVAEVTPLTQPDSSVQVLFQVREGRPRSVSGMLGYTNVGGIAVGGQWEHRNFIGGARTFAVSGTAETGVLAIEETPDEYFRGALSLRQPFLFISGLSLVGSPFGEYRDDYRDRSWEAGIDGTLVYRYAALQAVSLRYRISRREVLEYTVGGSTETAQTLGSAELGDSLEATVLVSAINLSATLGSLDDPANPTRGFILQPSLEVTAPTGFPTNEYFKAEFWGSGYHPLVGRLVLAGNLRAGRLFPFGGSIPPPESDGLLEALQLRDVNLMAGGPADVRGWGSRLLGPKVPDVEAEVDETGADTTYTADRYLALGGLARISAALELQFPIPILGSGIAGHVFLDGGRVWTPDDRYPEPNDQYDQDKAFFSTGGGVGIETPVGPIRVSVGYKLNPSPVDIRDPQDVLDLLRDDRPITDAPTKGWRRVQFHLTFGKVF